MSPWIPILAVGAAVAYIERQALAAAFQSIGQQIGKGLPVPPAAQAGNPISTAASANALAAAFKPVAG